jgi:DNA-binding NarL/FixJ family response regulator
VTAPTTGSVTGPVTVLLADDQQLIRAGFSRLLDSEPGIEVVAEADNGRRAVEQARARRPDVVLMDIRMPVLDGIAATREIVAATESRVLVLTTYDLDEYVFTALEAGASGFLLKDAPPEDLVRAITVVAQGDSLIAPRVTTRLVGEVVRARSRRRSAERELGRLTARELEVLQLVAQGLSNQEVASRLHLGESTVKTHVAAVLDKLAVRDRVQAVVFAYETGLSRPGQS